MIKPRTLVIFLVLVSLTFLFLANVVRAETIKIRPAQVFKVELEKYASGCHWNFHVEDKDIVEHLYGKSIRKQELDQKIYWFAGLETGSTRLEFELVGSEAKENPQFGEGEDLAKVYEVEVISAGESLQYTLGKYEILEIYLQENPSTGYQWQGVSEDNDKVKLLHDTYIPNPTAAGKLGAPGVHVWYLLGLEIGTAHLNFEYSRPGQAEEVERLNEYVIEVVPGGM